MYVCMYVYMYVCLYPSRLGVQLFRALRANVRARAPVEQPVPARCRVKAAPEITGSHSYVTALRRLYSLEAKLVTKRTRTHVHVSSV